MCMCHLKLAQVKVQESYWVNRAPGDRSDILDVQLLRDEIGVNYIQCLFDAELCVISTSIL
jgi:hypothetical protein